MSANLDTTSGPSSPRTSDNIDLTVVIAAYNAEATIADALASIAAVGPWPVIVVDDGSSDRTAEIAAELGATVLRQDNQGAGFARSAGLKVAESEFIIFLDSDDALLPGALVAARLLLANPAAGVVGGLITPNSSSSQGLLQPHRSLPEQLNTQYILNETYSPWPQSAAIWRRSSLHAAKAVSPPPLNPRFAEDFELLIRVSLVSEVIALSEHTCLHRLAGGKSATNAVEAVRQSERVRSYYSSFLGMTVEVLSLSGIRDQAAWRQFRASQAEFGLPRALIAAVVKPAFLSQLICHRGRRLIHRAAFNRH